jgi:hypothetical protein
MDATAAGTKKERERAEQGEMMFRLKLKLNLNSKTLLVTSAALAALANPVLAGPTTGPSPTVTPTPSPMPTPTTIPDSCLEAWPVVTVLTAGKGNSPSNNAKVVHAITGHVIDPSKIASEANQIQVCKGTTVNAAVTDLTGGTPLNQATSSGITCDSVGCTVVNIQRKEKYTSRSADGTDTDRFNLVPK